jgi:glycosyltransferase involved in cell wall biosynthesis
MSSRTAIATVARLSVEQLAQALADEVDPARRGAITARLRVLVSTFGGAPAGGDDVAALLAQVEHRLRSADPGRTWLTLAVLSATLPDIPDVQRAVRAIKLDGPLSVLRPLLLADEPGCPTAHGPWSDVEVITNQVVVDLNHTSQTSFATGIQRVAREVARRWHRDHDVVLIGWTAPFTALRRLTPAQSRQALFGETDHADTNSAASTTAPVLVPWRCTHLLPELLAEPHRTERFHALLRHSATFSGVIGFDCVPLMSAETTIATMTGAFCGYLAALTDADRIATISAGSALEYRSWRRMLSASGRAGPKITSIPLAVDAGSVTDESLAAIRDLIGLGSLPVVLVVGSHEPRKNHLAVLHAAELLWRSGLQFNLVFVGGNSWNSDHFHARLRQLQDAGRPLMAITALPDHLLWAAYRLARCTVFPSLSEGFGLPVAESLACGTPVITSDFGSMREIAADGGALLIDPRNEDQLADTLNQLLTDDDLHARLSATARARTPRSWDDYATDTWHYLIDGARDTGAAQSTVTT